MNTNISKISNCAPGFLASLSLNELKPYPELPSLEFDKSVTRLDAEIQMLKWNKHFDQAFNGEGMFVPDLDFDETFGCRFVLIGNDEFLSSYLTKAATNESYIVPGVAHAPEA